jgi:drug/metabolite transporter (DMT)-like permease
VVENVGSTGTALLLLIAGLVVAIVGDHGQRRATTWFGLAVAAIGTIAAFTLTMKPSSTGGIATTLTISGLVLIAVPAVAKIIRTSRSTQTET